ncbi:MAG: response regulator [Bacteroidota bacterium]
MIYKKPLSVGQVADVCRVSKKTVLNWIYGGALKAFTTYGGHYRVWPADLRTFVNETAMDIQFDFVDDRRSKILIIDDDHEYTAVLKIAITQELPNAEVLLTDDGYEGLLLIGELQPQLVILDLKMPKVDGFQVLELLKSRKQDNALKILVVSSYLDDEALRRLKNSVADGYLEKTGSVKDLLSVILRTLGEKKAPKERHDKTFA